MVALHTRIFSFDYDQFSTQSFASSYLRTNIRKLAYDSNPLSIQTSLQTVLDGIQTILKQKERFLDTFLSGLGRVISMMTVGFPTEARLYVYVGLELSLPIIMWILQFLRQKELNSKESKI